MFFFPPFCAVGLMKRWEDSDTIQFLKSFLHILKRLLRLSKIYKDMKLNFNHSAHFSPMNLGSLESSHAPFM